MNITGDRMKFLRLLSEKYPTRQQVCTEIINLQAILNLPKGTEHFMSDLHGEYEAFFHILNNSAGVIREKVDMAFEEVLTARERSSLCTLIYYPQEKLRRIREEGRNTEEWYRFVLQKLIDLAKLLSSKYTRSKVRKAMPSEYSYILDELLHAQPDEDNNQLVYHSKIIDTLLRLEEGDDFIIALSSLIKRLAVDHLHIVGDIFDRGERPDAILNMLMDHHSLDIEWGNHDILWMGAACGSQACIAAVVRNCLSYNNISVLEQGYGISLRPLVLFAEKMYDEEDPNKAAKKAISIILFKLEGQIIRRNPEYQMEDRLLLDKVDYENACIELDGKSYPLKEKRFPTVDRDDRTSFRRQSGKSWMSWKSCFWKASSYSAMSNFCTATAVCIRCSTATCCSTAVCRWMRTERSKPSIWREGFIRAEATWIMRIWLPVGRSSTRTRRSAIWISCGICGAAAILRCRAG